MKRTTKKKNSVKKENETKKVLFSGVRAMIQVIPIEKGKAGAPQLMPDQIFITSNEIENSSKILKENLKELYNKYNLEEAEIK